MALFEAVDGERRDLGWMPDHAECEFVIGPPRCENESERLLNDCLEADVMVFGACPMRLLEARAVAGKLTLVMSERLLKKPHHSLRIMNPRYARGIGRYRRLVNQGAETHALAIGHHAAGDLHKIGAFPGRIWRWGYFVDAGTELAAFRERPALSVLWAGRMLKWKRVDVLLRALALLEDSGESVQCTLVGDGPERCRLIDLAHRLGLGPPSLSFSNPVPFDQVRQLMRESDVYVLTSNRLEGWGAVAGEAMAEGCVLVANDQAGSSKELVLDGETGFLFGDGDAAQLAAILRRIGANRELQLRIRQQAWGYLSRSWHPQVAAERLVELCRGLLGLGALPAYDTGPCQRLSP